MTPWVRIIGKKAGANGRQPRKGKGGGGNKFGAKLCACHAGHNHHSRAEARRCNDLHLLVRGGVIRNLEQQPQFWFAINGRQVKHENGRRLGYKADFRYEEQDGAGGWRAVVEDVKGPYRDDAWTIRKAVFRALFPEVDLREVA
ncbi:DUF1064 domain-containing protein [Novosphingobium humi]|uniref:DUF1064 domain-containing protein n=1 Tax=Novosphingobium humi TaxID=2282397 RepID=A0ABY7U2T3_9SPHN|nr:DUF1064 domain-containing protein [Novosphingobium humi]WCT78895.1 DUF1064 domain-containing protein [Novosphingobium humi]